MFFWESWQQKLLAGDRRLSPLLATASQRFALESRALIDNQKTTNQLAKSLTKARKPTAPR
jgi:hypothetical protein